MFVKAFVLSVLFIFVLDLCEINALKVGDTGVCVGKISQNRTKRVSYTKFINKWCGRRRCSVRAYRTQQYTVVNNVTMCCSGWQYRPGSDDCAALCSTGCLGGTCVAPETCRCAPPAYLHPEHKNACVTPHCDPQCVNGVCTPHDVCSCPYNSTHCMECGPDCTTGPCMPKLPYYLYHACNEPRLSSCGNTVIDICSCLRGYSRVNSSYCAPICDNCNAECVAPNVCKCPEGYNLVNGSCEPVCNAPCLNGNCTGPNECTCQEGYVKNVTQPNVCYKPCENPCKGTCDLHGECTCTEMVEPNNFPFFYDIIRVTQDGAIVICYLRKDD